MGTGGAVFFSFFSPSVASEEINTEAQSGVAQEQKIQTNQDESGHEGNEMETQAWWAEGGMGGGALTSLLGLQFNNDTITCVTQRSCGRMHELQKITKREASE